MKNCDYFLGKLKKNQSRASLLQSGPKTFKRKKKRFVPPGALCLLHTNTSVQVGPGLRFTVETQKREGVSHFVKEK